MTNSKLTKQGELVIDHRNSPGIDLDWARARGVTGPIVGAGKTYESGLKNCKHCGGDVLLHPQRQRERVWCYTCDSYICDNCGLLQKQGHPCQPLAKTLETIFTKYQNIKEF